MLKLTRQCLFSPRLYRIYGEGLRNVLYEPNKKESFGDKVIISVTTIMNITYYASPFLCMYILKRGFFSYFELKIMGNLLGGIGCFVAFCFALRAYGRASNPKYVRFLRDIKSPSANQQAYLERIRRYDFDFNAWPVNYKVAQCEKPSWALSHPFKSCANADLPVYQRVPLQVLAFFAIHTFGLRLIYPGTLALIQRLIANALISGRTQMVELFNGRRAKVATADGNMIDTMFVDNTAQSAKGKILVVSCEGNSGYYEVGLMSTPVKCGYSALGWNHPGFGWSTGVPFPKAERNAIDAVMQYAINELRFQPEDIVLLGWSIGGYTATWAAVNYPIRALILDATFDDLLYLAQNQMPSSWSLLVKEVIRTYVDLNIVTLLKQYDGPVQLIRRTDDEVICLRRGLVGTNRGNYLLSDMIMQRHPELFKAGASRRLALQKYVSMLETHRVDVVTKKEEDQQLLQLIAKYSRDFRGMHCTPLSDELFDEVMERVATRCE
ncbi:phosphatidylserine lipase ABHD16A isoform X2 [Manduca sexta]|uniref:AB hydrolase-1 domain-containing protein n=1 Tax=Manduca sexta TaxID=7130 RepID=A0A921ZAP8_MANSE|nr:phosphatidylserine lipase ABHD16A isoform X2 [Manduca sexta]KAG6453399.1 hypothetical protein O3G_MSEX008132 [Manduca sexta]